MELEFSISGNLQQRYSSYAMLARNKCDLCVAFGRSKKVVSPA